jgi:DNA-directed RNA polymerase specialized sigma24 family protein
MTGAYRHDWPSFSESYTDEFGQVDREVYEAAGSSWPRAAALADSALRDAARGLELMQKAVALVTRVRRESPGHISNLPGYVFVTFRRLILAELESDNGHRLKQREYHDLIAADGAHGVDLETKILLQQLEARMDDWARKVFHLLTLGHTYEEIGPVLGTSAHAAGKRFREQLNRLRAEIEAESRAARAGARVAAPRDPDAAERARKNI